MQNLKTTPETTSLYLSKEALKKLGRYAGMTAIGTFMILSPKKAQAASGPIDPGGFGF